MLVLSLCNKFCPDKLPVIPGNRIDDGADGEIFTITNVDDKVIKFGVLYDPFDSDSIHDKNYNNIQSVIDVIINTQPRAYVRVFSQGYLGTYCRDILYGRQDFILYYYIMEKLKKISEDERKVFHSILC